MAMQLTTAEFFGTPISVIDHNNRRWLTANEAGRCLGYNEANAGTGITNLYKRHEDEFTDEDSLTIKLMENPKGGNPNTRIFSATGCQKLGFFANTARAKDFRTWAARFLAGNAVPPAPTPDARLDRLDANMAQLAAGMNTVLRQLNVTGKYIGLLEMNQSSKRRVTPEVVQQVHALAAEGMNFADIGRLLRISRTTVSLVAHGKYHAMPAGAALPEKSVAELLDEHLAREQAALTGALTTAEG